MSICNRLDLQTQGSQPVMMPKSLPDRCSKLTGNFPEVLNFNRLFLKVNRFIRN